MKTIPAEKELIIGDKTYPLKALNVRQILGSLRIWGGRKVAGLKQSLIGQGVDAHTVAAIVAEQETMLTSTAALMQMADCLDGQIQVVAMAAGAPESEVETLGPRQLTDAATFALGGDGLKN